MQRPLDSEREKLLGNMPTGLKGDPLLNRLFFRFVPNSVLISAERSERPWQLLRACKGLPEDCYKFFDAAESASRAAERLCLIQVGIGSLNRDPLQKILEWSKAGKHQEAEKLTLKILERMCQAPELWPEAHILGLCKNDDERRGIAKALQDAKAKLIKRYGREWPAKVNAPVPEEARNDRATEFFMVSAWLRWPVPGCTEGAPGLCFYSDEALADFCVLLRREDGRDGFGTRTEFFRTIRTRLGLRHVNYHQPFVTKVRPATEKGRVELTFTTDEGPRKAILPGAFSGGRIQYPLP